MLFDAAQRWLVVELDERIRARVGEPFPSETVRTLDAIHLATCLELEHAIGPLELLSTDVGVRRNAQLLGLRVVPDIVPA